jgi:hypothetical protein
MNRRQFTTTIALLAVPAAVMTAYVAINPSSFAAKLIASGAVSASVLTGIRLMVEIVKLDADNRILRNQRESRLQIPSATEVERYRRAHRNARLIAASGALGIVAGSSMAVLLGSREDPEKQHLRSEIGALREELKQVRQDLSELDAVQQMGTTKGPPELEITNRMPGVPARVVVLDGGGRDIVLGPAEKRNLTLPEGHYSLEIHATGFAARTVGLTARKRAKYILELAPQ